MPDNDMITVRFSAERWNQMLAILAEAVGFPWRITNPLIVEIRDQGLAQLNAAAAPPPSVAVAAPEELMPSPAPGRCPASGPTGHGSRKRASTSRRSGS